MFLIQLLFKIDGNPLWSIPTPQYICLIHFYSNLMEILSGAHPLPNTYSLFNYYSNLMEILSEAPSLPNTYSLVISYSKLMEILSEAPTLSPIHMPYSILIQN